jgi:hypothetical protein
MASDAKIRANRANAQKSTGPRTPAGKDRSRLNATRHNITGIVSLRSRAEKEAFDAYSARLIPDFDAATDVEYELASRIVDVMFRLARISTLEANLLAITESDTATAAPLTDVDRAIAQTKAFIRESRTFSNLSLYEQRLSRTLSKDLDTFQRLRSPKPQQAIVAQPRPTMIRWISDGPNPAETMPPVPIGFVFSTPEPDPAPPALARPIERDAA